MRETLNYRTKKMQNRIDRLMIRDRIKELVNQDVSKMSDIEEHDLLLKVFTLASEINNIKRR